LVPVAKNLLSLRSDEIDAFLSSGRRRFVGGPFTAVKLSLENGQQAADAVIQSNIKDELRKWTSFQIRVGNPQCNESMNPSQPFHGRIIP